MSNTNDTTSCIAAILSATALVYTGYHAWRFDKCRCLLPQRKQWFKVLLTWQLILCSAGVFVWGTGWAAIKYKLGWVYLPEYGAVPYPTSLYTDHYKRMNNPLTACLAVGYSLQISLNAEEALYWSHLMRAVRRPKSAKGWYSSPFFGLWIAVTLLTPVAIFLSGWVRYVDMDSQMARMSVVGGGIELGVVACSTYVVYKFPEFLSDIRTSGAGPEVRSRLHFYHEVNKVRTLFRFLFTASVLILGVDGMTNAKKINLNHLAADLLTQASYLSFFVANMASVLLYLPRSFGDTAAHQRKVMVGHGHAQPQSSVRQRLGVDPNADERQQASHALLSLLREGGQWDADDDIRAGLTMVQESKVDGAYLDKRENDWDYDEERQPGRLSALENWTSPFTVPVAVPKIPTDLKIHVKQEIENDSLDSVNSTLY